MSGLLFSYKEWAATDAGVQIALAAKGLTSNVPSTFQEKSKR